MKLPKFSIPKLEPQLGKEIDSYIKYEIRDNKSTYEFDNWHRNKINEYHTIAIINGRDNYPDTASTDTSLAEKNMAEEYSGELQKLLSPALRMINKLSDDYLKVIQNKLSTETTDSNKKKSENTAYITNKIADLNSITSDLESKTLQQITDLNNAKSTIERDFTSRSAIHKRQSLNNKIPLILGWVLLIILAVVEAPINAQVFQFFRLSQIETYIIATSLIIGFPLLSHFTALSLHKGNNGKPNFRNSILFFVLIILFCFSLNLFRVSFMDIQSHLEESNYTAPSFMSYIFDIKFIFSFMLNIFLFVLGITIGYYMHDSDIEFEKAFKKRVQFNKSFTIKMNKLQGELLSVKNQKANSLTQLNQELVNLNNEVDEYFSNLKSEFDKLVSKHDEIIIHCQHLEKYVTTKHKGCVLDYRSLNQANRTSPIPTLWSSGSIDEIDQTFTLTGLTEIN